MDGHTYTIPKNAPENYSFDPNLLAVIQQGGSAITDEKACALFVALRSCPKLYRLQFGCLCLLSPRTVTVLADTLPAWPRLQKLHISDACITHVGAVALAGALLACPRIHDINVANNNIGDAGAIAFANALPACPSLRYLNVSCNQIGDAGAIAFAKALVVRPNPMELRISTNGFRNDGSNALKNAIRYSYANVHEFDNSVVRNLGMWEMLALMSAGSARCTGAARRFVDADGDRAIASRVLRFLITMKK